MGGDTNIINIYLNGGASGFMLQGNISIDEVHHGLECGWGIGKAKTHHPWFKECVVCLKCHLLFVSFLDLNIVVSTANINFGVEGRTSKMLRHGRDVHPTWAKLIT